MTGRRSTAVTVVLTGVGATLTMDIAAGIVRRATGVEPLDYRLLARWIGHMPQGRFIYENIGEAAPVRAEKRLGMLAHYGVGVSFAALLSVCHPDWTERPTLGPALVTGLGTSVAPFFLMQPAFGMGIAGSKTPDPTITRLRTLRTHASYGLGLYLAGRISVGTFVMRKR